MEDTHRIQIIWKTGVFVSETCLTHDIWKERWDLGESVPHSTRVQGLIERAIDVEMRFIDIADDYSDEQAETILGPSSFVWRPREWFCHRQKDLWATGFGPNFCGLLRYHIFHEVEGSLRRLRVENIDFCQVCRMNESRSFETHLKALNDLVRIGLVRDIGTSNWSSWQIMMSLGNFKYYGVATFESTQAYRTIVDKDTERGIISLLKKENFVIWHRSPLSGGVYHGKYRSVSTSPAGSRRSSFDFPPVPPHWAHSFLMPSIMIADSKNVPVA